MTEEKFTRLSEQELDLVAGGAKHKDTFVFKLENGNYSVIKFSCDLDDASYKKVYDKASKGIVPDFSDIGLNGDIRSFGFGAKDYDKFVKLNAEQGYALHVM